MYNSVVDVWDDVIVDVDVVVVLGWDMGILWTSVFMLTLLLTLLIVKDSTTLEEGLVNRKRRIEDLNIILNEICKLDGIYLKIVSMKRYINEWMIKQGAIRLKSNESSWVWLKIDAWWLMIDERMLSDGWWLVGVSLTLVAILIMGFLQKEIRDWFDFHTLIFIEGQRDEKHQFTRTYDTVRTTILIR
jgi:hypothetical protein